MVEVYVLIQTQAGMALDVVAAISAIPGVVRAKAVTGPYDVIVWAEGETVDGLGYPVIGRIQQVEGVFRTLSCPVVMP
ncbi:Lrp/AsnC ligand binding domain-containing protein [Actinacidiphila glaucinigra]|uniref:Lrp/AsnC ligand binding domain-containing protein n=1 Tax=Actinacidiphila glaucinigra TaxID=235986 RepID=UPI002DD933B7|nr:Lrp/AsnC ligand binding domain-containing protein [Actinacidiphila glaucinigra]WSD64944.1 Lrp/AsnC ligand binding domain-containing protein [Actinacidiphila glaucinigra]